MDFDLEISIKTWFDVRCRIIWVHLYRLNWRKGDQLHHQQAPPPYIMKQFTFLVAAALALSQLCTLTAACSCLPPSVQSSYFSADKVIIGRVLKKSFCPPGKRGCVEFKPTDEVPFPPPDRKIFYTIKVFRSFKGCARRWSKIVVKTESSSAACGVNLKVGEVWYLNIRRGSIGLCDYNRKAWELTRADRKFLGTRLQCCKSRRRTVCRCNNGRPQVNCFVDPCRFAKPPCTEAKVCKSNFCGGCNADWFKKDGETPACLPDPFK